MQTLTITIIVVLVVLVGLGVAYFVRRQIAESRAGLKNVDRSKLKDLDHDAWADEERRDDKNDPS